MQLSIIIPTCNRNDMLALCLDRLAPGMQTLDALLYEVIVTDDGKSNEAKGLIETNYPWVQWIAGPKHGPAANRNNGAKLAKGEWLVFTDDDCQPDRNWLQEYYNAIKQYPEGKAFEGAILPDDWSLLKKDMAECPVNDKGGCFWSANIMIEKDIFWKIGGFDERFRIAAQEDQDLYRRILIADYQIHFLKNSIVYHPVRIVSLNKKLKSIDKNIFNWLNFYDKYNNPKRGKIRLEQMNLHLKISILSILKGKRKKSFLHLITACRFLFIKL